MRFYLLLVLVFSLLIPHTVNAQTDTYTTDNFSFEYPTDWEISLRGEDSVTFSAPIAATGIGQTGDIQIESGGLPVTVTVSATGKNELSAEALALAEAEIFAAETQQATVTDAQNLLLNGQPLSIVDVLTDLFDSRYLVVDLGSGNTATVWLSGVMEQFAKATPMVLEMLNTLRLTEDTTPVADLELVILESATYTRPNQWLAFEYPADWQVEEMDTHTLLTTPGGVTIGISGEPLTPDIPDTPDVPVQRVEQVIGRVEQDVPGILYDEILEFTFNDRPAARVLILDEQGIGFGYIVVGMGESVYANVTVIGQIESVLRLDPTVIAILHSLSIPGSSTGPSEPSDTTGLTQAFTGSNLTFKYPEGWFAYDVETVAIISNNDALVQSGDLNNVQAGDIVIFVVRGMENLPEFVLSQLPEDVTPLDIVTAISAEPEAAGATVTREKILIGGHSSAISYGTDNVYDLLDIAIRMDDGEIVTLLVFFRVGGLDSYQDTVLAIADTVSTGE